MCEFLFVIGFEICGMVEVVGLGVIVVDIVISVGDCVVSVLVNGVYVEFCIVLVFLIVKVFDDVMFEVVVLVLLKGLMVYYLLKLVYLVKCGDIVLVYVGVGGVGLILI